jgi:drug/metabolite transporter (DMT)-like permease
VIDRRTSLLLTLPPLFWAGNAVFARLLVGEVPPLALSLLRWVIALAMLLPFAWSALREHADALLAEWKAIALLGVLGIGGYNTFQYLAVQTSTALNVTLIASSTPVFILAVGALFFSERTRGAQWLGAGLSVLGVLVVLTRGDPANLLHLAFVPGDLIMLAANLTWTLYTWLLRKHRPDLPFAPLLAMQMMIGLLAIAPLAAAESLLGTASIHWSATVVVVLIYIALLPSIVAYYCWDQGIKRVGAVIPVYFANLTPLFAAALSTLLLGEAPRLYHAVALAMIVGGIHLAMRSATKSAAAVRAAAAPRTDL